MQLKRHIGLDEDGRNIKTVLKHGFKLSATLITRLKNHRGIYVNGKPVYTNHICRVGDIVTLDIAAAEPVQDIRSEHAPLDILYEDVYILAVNKPEGMLTHPSRSQFEGSLMGFVLGYLSRQRIHSCHALNRLDRYTSGVVLFAKNAYAKAFFTTSLQNAHKEYIAVTYGKPPSKSGTIDLPIDRLQSGKIMRGIMQDGARAVTHYELLDVLQNNMSVLRLKPETGRTHQLRVHCLALGCPIVGDTLYHTDESKILSDHMKVHGQLLHAERLRFIHPASKVEVNIFCKNERMVINGEL